MANEKVKNEMVSMLMLNLGKEIDKHIISLGQHIRRLELAGMSKQDVAVMLKTDAANGGRIFGALKYGIQEQAIYSMNLGNSEAKLKDASPQQKYTWISTMSGTTCPDCAARHGESMTMSDWESLGVPGSGGTVCGQYCQCDLLPDSIVEENPQLWEKPITKDEINTFKERRKDGMNKFVEQKKDAL